MTESVVDLADFFFIQVKLIIHNLGISLPVFQYVSLTYLFCIVVYS